MRWMLAVLLILPTACKKERDGGEPAAKAEPGTEPARLSGVVRVDGSSTVFPVSEAVAEEFGRKHEKVRVTVGISGTGGGFKKFCAGEIDISDASRPIKETEVELCRKNGIEWIELPIAYDGIAVVVHPKNDWVDQLTVQELRTIWAPEAQGKVTRWNHVRPGWPDRELHLFGAGVDSGTYDYFTEAVVGKEHASRGDFTSSEDDNVLVQGVSTDENALGFFGFAYYLENQDKLKIVPIDGGQGPVTPTVETIKNGRYQPLSRPIFIYVKKTALDRPEVAAFVQFYLDHVGKLAQEVGYVPLSSSTYARLHQRVKDRVTGSLFGGKGSQVGANIEKLLEQSGAASTATPAPAAPTPPAEAAPTAPNVSPTP